MTHVLQVVDVILSAFAARRKGKERVPLHVSASDVWGDEVLAGADVNLGEIKDAKRNKKGNRQQAPGRETEPETERGGYEERKSM